MARGVEFETLPRAGYPGEPPEFPLPDASERELAVWRESWALPQGHIWSREPWRIPTVALWVRTRVRCEDPEAPASLLAQLHRFDDKVGMSTAGLAESGFAIVDDAPSEKSEPVGASVDSLAQKRASRWGA